MNLETNWKLDHLVLDYITSDLKQISKTVGKSMDEIRIHIDGFGNFSANEMIKKVKEGNCVGRVFYSYYELPSEVVEKGI